MSPTHGRGAFPELSEKPDTATTLEKLQTNEQKRVLDIITLLQKCGLDSVLDVPRIVVCGDQSAGKSSVLEALTEIPFPRSDNLCTRYATEISLRNDTRTALTIRVIANAERLIADREKINKWSRQITDLKDLPDVMDEATRLMRIASSDESHRPAFARDILSVEITGPHRPQLNLVDIPGLIQSSTKGVSESDVAMVASITDRYISQGRTICLAVISATNDAANQSILERVRKVDPEGERTLGVITKPDLLPKGSGSESKFIELARNEDVYFKLGWHVIKNRKFEETALSFAERNVSEALFFETSNFNVLPKDHLGIDALRVRLSHVLLQHIKATLPRLMKDMNTLLDEGNAELKILGASRSSAAECRAFLFEFSMQCNDICKGGLNGQYRQAFFKRDDEELTMTKKKKKKFFSVTRLRAAVQLCNYRFSEDFRCRGHKYNFTDETGQTDDDPPAFDDMLTMDTAGKMVAELSGESENSKVRHEPRDVSPKEARDWVQEKLIWSRGTELVGNFNPQVIDDMFQEQSSAWDHLAQDHIENVTTICQSFLHTMITQLAPRDMSERIW